MTKIVTVTEGQIARAIRAAQKCGLRVKSIHPVDGTVDVEPINERERVTITGPEPDSDADDWADD